jgi:hypothetical protein
MTTTWRGTLAAAALCVSTVAATATAQEFPRREPVELPADVEAIFRAQMLTHIVSLDSILTALAKGDYAAAASVVDGGMGVPRAGGIDVSGRTEPGGAPGPGLGFGQYMPPKFVEIGGRFHEATTTFATLAKSLPAQPTAEQHMELLGALADVTAQCKACHDSFLVR